MGETDRHVERRVRQVRRERGIPQGELADRLGISHQMLQKYETGKNAIGASMLAAITAALSVPLRALYESDDRVPDLTEVPSTIVQRTAEAHLPTGLSEVRAEVAAKARAVDAKTARLKAQRVAKEAADAAAQRPPDGGHARKPSRKRPPKLIANPDEGPGG
jgi:transcriptional regulator with XRE-family HTH domain